ncbi:hypothetical protein GCM10029963_01090 [Micromonospora andamanensis]
MSRDPANRFLIGAAVLSLLAGLARERQVLVVVDDAQWVDEASALCLGFVARRLATEPIAVLLTGHEDPASGPWEGLPALQVGGLADEDARQLLTAVVPGIDAARADRTVRAAGGNPLALHELPTLDRESDDEATLPPAGNPVPVGPRLRQAFCARAEALKPSTRALLLLAAAEGRGDRHVVHRAGAAWGVDTSAWDEALRSGLLHASGTRLEFRHPLIPAAIYDGSPFAERQAVHQALAAALPRTPRWSGLGTWQPLPTGRTRTSPHCWSTPPRSACDAVRARLRLVPCVGPRSCLRRQRTPRAGWPPPPAPRGTPATLRRRDSCSTMLNASAVCFPSSG